MIFYIVIKNPDYLFIYSFVTNYSNIAKCIVFAKIEVKGTDCWRCNIHWGWTGLNSRCHLGRLRAGWFFVIADPLRHTDSMSNRFRHVPLSNSAALPSPVSLDR